MELQVVSLKLDYLSKIRIQNIKSLGSKDIHKVLQQSASRLKIGSVFLIKILLTEPVYQIRLGK